MGIQLSSALDIPQVATPSTNPAASRQLLYVKSDGKVYTKNSAGVEAPVDSGVPDPLILNEVRTKKIDFNPAGGGDITVGVSLSMGGNWIYGVHDPTNIDHAMTKGYADAHYDPLGAGGGTAPITAYKDYCRVASTGPNITPLSGIGQVIDGVTLAAGDRVLLMHQTIRSENGIWVAQIGSWNRATDMNASSMVAGARTTVREGTFNSGVSYVVNNWTSAAVLGTTNMVWWWANQPPPGSVMMWVSATPQKGWMLCDGSISPSRPVSGYASSTTNQYQNLYDAIGTTFGAVGAGAFSVPTMLATFPMGVGLSGANPALAGTGGQAATDLVNHSHSTASHQHPVGVVYTSNNATTASGATRVADVLQATGAGGTTASPVPNTQGSGALITGQPLQTSVATGENRPPYLAFYFVIKL